MAIKLQLPLQGQTFLDKLGNVQPGWYLFLNNLLAAMLALTDYALVVPTSGETVLISHSRLILKPAGTLAALTITLPSNPIDGATVGISTTQAITALTISPASGSVIGPTSLTALQAFRLTWVASIATWMIAP